MSFSDGRWERLQELYVAGLELDLSQRAQLIDRECRGDNSMAAQLEKMWAAANCRGLTRGFGHVDKSENATGAAQGGYLWTAGQRVCAERYEIESTIGKGGMGEVY